MRTKAWALEHLIPPRLDEALRCLKEALAIEPDELSHQARYADVLWDQGDFAQARLKYESIVTHATNTVDGGLLGWCHMRLGQFEMAEKYLQEEVAKGPKALELKFDLGLLPPSRGEGTAALTEYQDALKAATQTSTNRQRGLLTIAIADLRIQVESCQFNIPDEQSHKAMTSLQSAYNRVTG
ncbi:tetratricopeptide repeat protein [Candidatus Nitrospira allomarina]|uniref:Tetratricopeptide repeat protein n=1 Tax=Candidatus Nitrospira allomarina TaxID=3020900 RepID=A0AA96JU31_9BACT|nr:tetratricopeptide repeat protein [Candidatus Nitrospira allomarina]WNM59730.1 tetratricopeptide repeat protein [Candidatus Nitrospira allomarina]